MLDINDAPLFPSLTLNPPGFGVDVWDMNWRGWQKLNNIEIYDVYIQVNQA